MRLRHLWGHKKAEGGIRNKLVSRKAFTKIDAVHAKVCSSNRLLGSSLSSDLGFGNCDETNTATDLVGPKNPSKFNVGNNT